MRIVGDWPSGGVAIDAVPWTAPSNTVACTGSRRREHHCVCLLKIARGFVEAQCFEKVVHDVAEIEGVRDVVFIRLRLKRAEGDDFAVEIPGDHAQGFAATDHVVAAGAGLGTDPVLGGWGLV